LVSSKVAYLSFFDISAIRLFALILLNSSFFGGIILFSFHDSFNISHFLLNFDYLSWG
jgi:hypothetical protein